MSRASRFVWIKIVEWITKGVKFMSRASRFVWIKMFMDGFAEDGVTVTSFTLRVD